MTSPWATRARAARMARACPSATGSRRCGSRLSPSVERQPDVSAPTAIHTSAGTDELLAIADRVVAMAGSGEQVEAYVSRDNETSIRIYEGEVEHFVSAQSEGIGIRVISEGRTGFSYAGTLDEEAVSIALDEARDNVAFGTPDEWAALAEPDGVDVVAQELWSEELASFPTARKVELAKELERLALAADGRVRIDDANYADAAGESAVATTTGVRRSGRENGCYLVVSTLADDDGETQTGFGFTVGRSPSDFDLAKAAREAAEHLQGPRRRAGGQRRRHADRRPDEPAGVQRHRHRRRRIGCTAQLADRRWRAAWLRAQQLLG